MTPEKRLITLFGNDMSQPSRAVRFFLNINRIPHNFKLVKITEMQQRKPEFLRVNPLGKVPAIKVERPNGEDPFYLSESVAILKLLQEMYSSQLACSFSPAPTENHANSMFQRACVESYLHSHHETTRKAFAGFFQMHHLFPMLGLQVSDKDKEKAEVRVKKNLRWFNAAFLSESTPERPFMLQMSQPTLADLMAYEEMAQMKALPQFTHFSEYPKVEQWMSAMEKLPAWEESHRVLLRVGENNKTKNTSKM